MPKKLEEALKRRAAELGYKPKTDRYNRYVYGTLARVEAERKGSQHGE